MSDQATAATDAMASGSARVDDTKTPRVRGFMADGRQRHTRRAPRPVIG